MDEDLKTAVSLLQQIGSGATSASHHVDSLLTKVQKGEINTAKGLSFLEMKYQTLLSYMINLTYMLSKKTRGQAIEGDTSIERLTELRTVLEKIRPIDQKLKYQIDKLVKTATTGAPGISDPLRFKANPDNFVNKLDDKDDSESDEEDEEDKKSKVYVPPKLAAVHYDGDESVVDKQQKMVEKAKKRAMSSAMLRDLRDQYSEGPQEIQESQDFNRSRANRRHKERTEYEEEHFTRLAVSKKERNAMRGAGAMSSLNNLTRFDEIGVLSEEMQYLEKAGQSSKKRKLGGKGKKGKKGFRKKKRH